ncbi:MAG TPA: winged helix-turn-helix domain-containing protein [Bacillales bacterium]|nr:winged helix-turn-helix domain-containing protein [Bacillales bacterium]
MNANKQKQVLDDWYEAIKNFEYERSAQLNKRVDADLLLKDEDLILYRQLLKARYLILLKDHDKAALLLDGLHPPANEHHWLHYYFYFFHGHLEYNRKNYKKALAFYAQAERTVSALNDEECGEFYYKKASALYRDLRFERSRRDAAKALALFAAHAHYKRMADCENLLGLHFEDRGELESAHNHYMKALYYIRKAKNTSSENIILYNIGVLYANHRHFAEALPYFKRVFPKWRETDNDFIAQTYYFLSKCCFQLGKTVQGKDYLDKGLAYAISHNNVDYRHHLKLLEAKFVDPASRQPVYQEAVSHFIRNHDWTFVNEYSREFISMNNGIAKEKRPCQQGADLVSVGNHLYFHATESWIAFDKQERIGLSRKESNLLKFFIAHEGEIISAAVIAAEIWKGSIQASGVRQAIHRLKKKLGPAAPLIVGRPQGGYVYTSP